MRFLAILWTTLKNIVNNWRLELSLLLGLSMGVGVVTSIPIYSSGSLQDAFLRRWLASSEGRPPYSVMVSHWSRRGGPEITLDQYRELDEYLHENVEELIGLRHTHYSEAGGLGINRFEPVREGLQPAESPYADISFMKGVQDRSKLVDGRWYSDEPQDGVIEAVVDVNTLESLNLLVGERYVYWYPAPEGHLSDIPITLRVVGAFRTLEEELNNPEWIYAPPFDHTFFIDKNVFLKELVEKGNLTDANWDWNWIFDHNLVRVHQLPALASALAKLETNVAQLMPETRLWNSPQRTFEFFSETARGISLFLGALSVPILGMVFYYIILTASLTVSRRRNEIAMLRSRGASAFQVVLSFLIEWLMLGGLAFLIGPYIGLIIARVMGASAGFLSFVDRRALPVSIVPDAYRYGAYAVGLSVLACLAPVIAASRFSIVTFKQDIVRSRRKPLWERFLLDFILLGTAYYGYRSLSQQRLIMALQQSEGSREALAMLMDPMLFFVPVVFLLGAGLLVLRIFPYIMHFLSWVTGPLRGVCWTLTARQLARNARQYTPLLLLLIVTVALGIYSAAAARTLSRNFEDRIMYSVGADAVLTEQWSLPTASDPDDFLSFFGGGGTEEGEDGQPPEPLVFEPPFYVHQDLPGVHAAARVLSRNVNIQVGGNFKGQAQMMAIVPREFADVAWYRHDLTPAHIFHYLNLLTRYSEGALLSNTFMEENHLNPGDWITLMLKNQPIDVFIVAGIDLWPTLYPEKGAMVVTNLQHVQQVTTLEPYAVWLSMERGTPLSEAVDSLREQGIWVSSTVDSRMQIIEGRREPHRMGFFGILSIGFLVSVAVTIMGFFLYTFLSLRARMLHFGVLRAIGLSVRQLISMLALEQVFSLGLGLVVGTLFGRLISNVFLPFLEQTGEFKEAIPQFTIVIEQHDLQKIYVVLLSMLLVGVLALAVVLFRMRLAQAVKMGEEV
ncbi:MAG: ABC transporter permease [Limnochordia bacterium]